MANTMYTQALNAFLYGGINWTSGNITAAVITSGTYTPNFVTDQYLSAIGSGQILGSAAVSGMGAVSGAATAGNVTVSGVVSGAYMRAVVVYQNVGYASGSPLICYLDTAGGNVLPGLTSDGAGVVITWDPTGVFKL